MGGAGACASPGWRPPPPRASRVFFCARGGTGRASRGAGDGSQQAAAPHAGSPPPPRGDPGAGPRGQSRAGERAGQGDPGAGPWGGAGLADWAGPSRTRGPGALSHRSHVLTGDFILGLFFSYCRIDPYGFERPEDFDYAAYEEFFSTYLVILTRRAIKWSKLLKGSGRVQKSMTGEFRAPSTPPSANKPCAWQMRLAGGGLGEGRY